MVLAHTHHIRTESPMASIRKRVLEDGTVRYDVTVTKRGAPRLYASRSTRALAIAWARETERDIERGAWRGTAMAEEMTLGQLLERYSEEVLPSKRSGADLQGRVRRVMKHSIVRLPLIALTPEQLAQFRDMRLKSTVQLGGPKGKTTRRISGQTVRHDLALIRAAIRHALREWGLVLPAGDPVQHVRLPPQSKGRERRTEGDEFERILAEARSSKSPKLAAAIEFSVETTMRRAEVCALRWKDINFERRIARCLVTKNGDPRDAPLSLRAIAVLQSLPRRDGDNDELIFGMKPGGYTQAFNRIVDRLGLQDIRLHDLRHEGASRVAKKLNGNVIALAKVTGHKTLAMLQRYTHLRAEDVATLLD